MSIMHWPQKARFIGEKDDRMKSLVTGDLSIYWKFTLPIQILLLLSQEENMKTSKKKIMIACEGFVSWFSDVIGKIAEI